MQRSHSTSSSFSRPGYLAEVTIALIRIRNTGASGRLSLRNGEGFGLAHLYFNHSRLVHVTGDRWDGAAVLEDLLTWSKGSIRFDAAFMVDHEDLTWQQAQVFTRWLSFLEMRAMLQGIPQQYLQGLTHSLTLSLPAQPVALPQEVKDYKEYNGSASKRQRQRLGEGVGHFMERTLPGEQREQIQQGTLSVAQHVQALAQQTSQATRALAQRTMKAFQKKLQQAVGMLENTDRLHTEEALQHTLDIESLQTEVNQSMPNNVQTMEQAGAPDVDQRPSPRPLPRSVRPARAVPASTIGTAD
jgi:hypothetical protein